ncbi:MAG: hypothetical protein HOP02_03165 [Methylococcaceae bacterium]|nr:hypothetical protein [Methylococcaceae bacterium]
MNISQYTRLAIILLVILIQACANPKYQTFYNYDPPTTAEGRACTFQCENTKMQCEQVDQMRLANCQDRAELNFQRCTDRAQAEYDRCKASGQKYCIADYCREETCNNNGQCENQYRRCFSICGGKVTSETRCVANCERK